MKSIYNKAIVAASMLMACSGAMAQELNSAYYTEDYNFRHEMNPAYGNERTMCLSLHSEISTSDCTETSAIRMLCCIIRCMALRAERR